MSDIAFEIYERNPYKKIARFRPEIDETKAEAMSACGTPDMIGTCSNWRQSIAEKFGAIMPLLQERKLPVVCAGIDEHPLRGTKV